MLRTIAMYDEKLLSVAVSITRPSGVNDGVDITSWRMLAGGQMGPAVCAAFMDGSEALTINSPTGGLDGPEIWGWRLSQWWRLGYLNNGLPIIIVSATQGFATQIEGVGIFDRLAVAGTPTVGTVTTKLIPIQEWQTP